MVLRSGGSEMITLNKAIEAVYQYQAYIIGKEQYEETVGGFLSTFNKKTKNKMTPDKFLELVIQGHFRKEKYAK